MHTTTIIAALAYECRKSLLLLEALAEARAADPARATADPLNGVVLRRRRNAAVLRSLLRTKGAEHSLPPLPRPQSITTETVIAAESRFLAYLERQLARPDLPADLRDLIGDQREDVIQATLILSRISNG